MSKDNIEACYQFIGYMVRESRERLGWTQKQLQAALNANGIPMDRTSIAKLETGRQRVMLHDVLGMATAMGVPYRKLLPPQPTLKAPRKRVISPELAELLTTTSTEEE